MCNRLDIVSELGFTDEEITECLNKKGLLSIELEFTKKCNLKCLYCYASAGEPLESELSLAELKSAILQAKELGAKKIILLGGGEPLLFYGLTEIVNYIHSLGLKQVLFTNGTLITEKIACFLFDKTVSVIVKGNSLKASVQDELAGVDGAFKKIRNGLQHLMNAGYPSKNAKLGIQTVICRQNIEEIPAIWEWARENCIIPYFEMLTYQGRAKENIEQLMVSTYNIKKAFKHLETIDKERFSINWEPHPTIAAFSCKRHLYSCLVNSQGYINPCSGIDIAIGNIKDRSLKDIIENSNIFTNLRNIYEKIEGDCKTCDYNDECYGCRGNAYQITGNYLASDPSCWHCGKVENESFTHICKQ